MTTTTVMIMMEEVPIHGVDHDYAQTHHDEHHAHEHHSSKRHNATGTSRHNTNAGGDRADGHTLK
jgi:hypothetical protein